MRNVRLKIACEIFSALVEANKADVIDSDIRNDLHPSMANQNDLYGTLSVALKQLGYEAELQFWVETGDRPMVFSRKK